MLESITPTSDHHIILSELQQALEAARGHPIKLGQAIDACLTFAENIVAHEPREVWPAGYSVSRCATALQHPENAEFSDLAQTLTERGQKIILAIASQNGQSASQAQSDLLRLADSSPLLMVQCLKNVAACAPVLATHDIASACHLVEVAISKAKNDPVSLASLVEAGLEVLKQADLRPIPALQMFNKLAKAAVESDNPYNIHTLLQGGLQGMQRLAPVSVLAATRIADDVARLAGIDLSRMETTDFVSRSFMQCASGPEGTGRVRIFLDGTKGQAYVGIDELPDQRMPLAAFAQGGTLGDFAKAITRSYPQDTDPARQYYSGIIATAHRLVRSPSFAPSFEQAVRLCKTQDVPLQAAHALS